MDKKMYILTYDHGGFVLWGDVVKPRLRNIAAWMEKYPKLKIGLDYESFTFDEFSKKDPEIVEMTKELLLKYPDRVGLGATTYGQPLSLTISEESNARQLLYAVRTNLHYFGKTPTVYAISEFALNNQTPQLIKLCGYKAAILRSHVMGYGYPKTFDSAWGKWIGKDGTQIPAVPTYDGQGRGYNCTTVDNWILSRWPVDSELYSLEDFEEMFSKYQPLLASRYDDLTQPIETINAYTENKDNYQYILLEEIPEIYGEAKDELKTEDNDFHVQMPWGYCGNEIFNGIRKGENDAVQGEKLNSLSVMLGGESLQQKSEEAWKYILAAQHHDVTICGLLDLSRRFIPTSLEASEFVKKQSVDTLINRFGNKENESFLVVNPHSFPIEEWVEVSVKDNVTAFDGENETECEIIEADGKKTLRVLVKLNPLSIKSYVLKNKTPQQKAGFSYNDETGELRTPCYTIKLTEKGIANINDVKTNVDIFNNGDGELFNGWVNDEEFASKGTWEVKVSTHSATAVQKGDIGGIPFRFEMNLNGESKRIDCKVQFEMNNQRVGRTDITQGRPVPLTLNGHHHEDKICFVANACLRKDRRMIRDLPYSISEWNGALRKTEEYWYPDDRILIDTEVSPEESFDSTTYYHGIYWVSLRDKEKGVAVFNKGCMGCALEGNRLYVPLVYSNEYMCGTRILEGVFEDEFAIMPFDSNLTDAELHRKAMVYQQSPIAVTVPKGDGDLTEFTAADFKSTGGEVILTAMYPEENDILARLCNYSDESATVKLTSAVGTVTAETDLLANEIDSVCNGELSFRPWEIKTVKIKLQK